MMTTCDLAESHECDVNRCSFVIFFSHTHQPLVVVILGRSSEGATGSGNKKPKASVMQGTSSFSGETPSNVCDARARYMMCFRNKSLIDQPPHQPKRPR